MYKNMMVLLLLLRYVYRHWKCGSMTPCARAPRDVCRRALLSILYALMGVCISSFFQKRIVSVRQRTRKMLNALVHSLSGVAHASASPALWKTSGAHDAHVNKQALKVRNN